MAEEKPKVTFCPNCSMPAIRVGNEVTCETCDATFTITQKDGAKVKQIGRIAQIEKDVAELKARLPGDDEPSGDEPGDQDPPAEEQEESDGSEDEEDIL